MNLFGLRFGALDQAESDHLLRAARSAMPTYNHVGSTLDPERWAVPAVRVRHRTVGRGPVSFGAARQALRTWVPQLGIGATVEPEGQAVVAGATVLIVLRRGPLHVVAPDRVVGVIDEPRRFGFAYGSLPGHPERGEESFVVEHLDDDTVRATIRVQAGPGTLAAHVVAPLVRAVQHAALDGYLAAIARHVNATATPERPSRGAP